MTRSAPDEGGVAPSGTPRSGNVIFPGFLTFPASLPATANVFPVSRRERDGKHGFFGRLPVRSGVPRLRHSLYSPCIHTIIDSGTAPTQPRRVQWSCRVMLVVCCVVTVDICARNHQGSVLEDVCVCFVWNIDCQAFFSPYSGDTQVCGSVRVDCQIFPMCRVGNIYMYVKVTCGY